MSSRAETTKTQFGERSREELANRHQVFVKYLCHDEDKDRLAPPKDGPIEKKVKIANKLYRQACVDSGVSLCFFRNFAAWQRFIRGEIEENEFYLKAIEEIHKLGVDQRSYN